ncbi:hypothetical protein [Maribacter thermophilus]|uniref:hypothetical protein n=1 Tax=Maribacter thermophilus TaxID=1197874 RepID=UPI000640CFA5|nr:hypothetical protein [Maribacter thermophilus]
MKKYLFIFSVLLPILTFSQQLKLAKGAVNDSLVVNGTDETFALYLPTYFEMTKTWPVLFVMDMKGRGKQSLSMFREAAEEEGYILAGSNSTNDTLSLSENVLVANRMLNAVYQMIPIHKERNYVAGIGDGGRFASLLPTFIKDVNGVITCGASMANVEVLSSKNPFYFIGIVGRGDYNYREVIETKRVLDRLKFSNLAMIFEGDQQWPPNSEVSRALRIFTLSEMAKGHLKKNDSVIRDFYTSSLVKANNLFSEGNPLLADNVLKNTIQVYHPFGNLDSLKTTQKLLRRSKVYKDGKRDQNNYFLKESLIKEDYNYYLEEDIITYNYNNLGWWNFQMEELDKMKESANMFEKRMGSRLRGYINALISDNINMIAGDEEVDVEALNFLYMLKTITEPKDPEGYLKVISLSSKIEDFGTALFYLEELLKTGYNDKQTLYTLEDTALLRITPEFNELVHKYLKDARYDVIEE